MVVNNSHLSRRSLLFSRRWLTCRSEAIKMKTLKLFLTCCLIFSLFACSHLSATEGKSPCPEDGWWKYVEVEVLKVLFAKDGDAIYKSYLVNWKDQEVVVSDSLARTDYQKGDIITIIAMAHSFPNIKEEHGLLSFEIAPPEVVEKLRKKVPNQ
jgi:hypothetical protein